MCALGVRGRGDASRAAQEHPRAAQERPRVAKSGQERAKSGPRAAQSKMSGKFPETSEGKHKEKTKNKKENIREPIGKIGKNS